LISAQENRSAVGIGGTLIDVIGHDTDTPTQGNMTEIHPPNHALSRLNLDTDPSFFGVSAIMPSTMAKCLKAIG
jgi:hypothetical protein